MNMSEKQPLTIREKVQLLAQESLQKSQPSAWFDILYQQAGEDETQIPWAKMQPYPYFQDWLNHNQGRQFDSSLVIGCGLGDDAEALAKLGWQNITAFDISPHAINWCRKRFPQSSVNYVVADLFDLDVNWQKKFDFVYECRNIQALPLNVRATIIKNIAHLVAHNGILLVLDRLRANDAELTDSPPWALSQAEFDLFTQLGFQVNNVIKFQEGQNNEITSLRIEYIKDS